MTVSLFSGQGSQTSGMGKDFLECPSLRKIAEKGSEILGRDLVYMLEEMPTDELSLTINAQPAIMTLSVMALECAKEKGFTFEGVAGHSLGEYAAMVASGVVSLEDSFRLIKARSEAMDESARTQRGAMSAIMKISPETVEEVCSKAKNYVAPVNYNSPVQTVIAGTPEGVAEVSEIFTEMKARVVPLNVAGAFHSQLMKSASEKFYETAKTVDFHKPCVRYYSNVTGGELKDFSDMAEILARHIISPVRFTEELNAMYSDGMDRFVEFGAGKTLTGLVKKTLKGVVTANVDSPSSVESL